MDARAHFLTLARYNVWATQRLLGEVQALTDAQYYADVGLFFKSVHGTLNHLLVGEHHLWRKRFAEGLSPKVALDAEVDPHRMQVGAALLDGARQWLPLIEGWDADRFEGRLSYTNMSGQRQNLPFAATLAHVFNHGTHHRGQVTASLTTMGRSCPELDLVYMLQAETSSES